MSKLKWMNVGLLSECLTIQFYPMLYMIITCPIERVIVYASQCPRGYILFVICCNGSIFHLQKVYPLVMGLRA